MRLPIAPSLILGLFILGLFILGCRIAWFRVKPVEHAPHQITNGDSFPTKEGT